MEKMSGSFFFSFCSSFLVIFRSDAPPWGQEQRPSARRHWSDRRRDYFFFFEMIGMKLLRLQRPPFSPLPLCFVLAVSACSLPPRSALSRALAAPSPSVSLVERRLPKTKAPGGGALSLSVACLFSRRTRSRALCS